jgi:L-alanine-DL-glutamate epimerase-like enolase superfamily enzyme
MKIARVQAFLLSYPFPEPILLPFHGGDRMLLKRDAMFLRVETEKGLAGYAPGPGSERAQAMIDQVIAPFLEGRRLTDPDALRVQFLAGPGRDPDVAKTYGSVEIALYDLVGKALGVPVSELLGGRVRDRIRLYGSAGMYLTPDAHAAEATAIRRLGLTAYKMRLAQGAENDLATLRLVRQTVGPDFDLMVDGHTWWRMGDKNYSFETIEMLAREMASLHLAWLEEPLPPRDHAAYLRLKEKDLVPLASGEHEADEQGYLDLILSQAVDYVQMDICFQGGYNMGRRLFPEIAREGLRFAFRSSGTALEAIAAAHLGICWPETVVDWLEYPCYSGLFAAPSAPGMYPFPLASEILEGPLELDHGDLIVPRKPGLGVTVDETVVERYPWIPGPWSYFRTDSPPSRQPVSSDRMTNWEQSLKSAGGGGPRR